MTQRRTKATSATAATAVLCLGLLTGCGGSDAAPQAVASPSSATSGAAHYHPVDQPHRPGADRERTEAQAEADADADADADQDPGAPVAVRGPSRSSRPCGRSLPPPVGR